ncbi:MAG TPA: shikimate dehydrogenase [Ruminococcus sp.]|nr:shikimate dehydrogenase [Ruminococcus sp.]
MLNYKLIGYPLGHSMSPWIHEHLFAMSGHEGAYALLEIAPESLETAFSELQKLNGFNITIPHKVAIIPFLDELDETAERYHSVNCVVNQNGKSVGYNTDCVGFLRSVPQIKKHDNILLIGSGGVGRMMATEAYLRKANLTIVEKNIAVAEALKQELESPYYENTIRVLDFAPDEHFDLLMNASPVGMFPKIDNCPVSDEIIANCDKVFDVIYNPTETLLVKKAKAMGKTAVGGSSMLVWQAVNAHEIWYGFNYDPNQIDELVREMEQEVNRLFVLK